jgi:hypothetical protein
MLRNMALLFMMLKVQSRSFVVVTHLLSHQSLIRDPQMLAAPYNFWLLSHQRLLGLAIRLRCAYGDIVHRSHHHLFARFRLLVTGHTHGSLISDCGALLTK